jgi:CheY-like chemotaxis protein
MLTDESLFKLVVIDDEPDMARLISDVADISGYTVEAYFDARDFVASYDGSVDVIFLDLIMPEMSGLEVIHFLAEKCSRANLILMTGFNTDMLDIAKEAAISANLNFVSGFRKPFRFDDLRSLLVELKKSMPPHA